MSQLNRFFDLFQASSFFPALEDEGRQLLNEMGVARNGRGCLLYKSS